MSTPSVRTWAVIDNDSNVVQNTIVWNGTDEWSSPTGTYLIEITGEPNIQIGYVYYKTNNSFDPE
jgi:hypothetical protein